MSTALVVGGGIAGLAAALRLTEAGVRVTLLETRKKLGGRATSFTDVRTGQVLDNCQHVVLGCCTNYMDLLGRLGAAEKIRWHREQYWIEEGGRVSVIRPGLLPAPAHFSGSMMRASFLSTADLLALARALLKILRADRRRPEMLRSTFGEFLASCGQPERLVRRFWSPVVVSACNLDVERVSAAVALHVFQEGFFASSKSADIGVPAVPLVELYADAVSLIESRGGKVLFGAGVARLDARSATTTDSEKFEADAVVCALPVERVNRVVDPEIQGADPRFVPFGSFTHSPILGVHLVFDRPVMGDLPHAVLVDRPTQWLFRKDAAGVVSGSVVHAVISAADAWLELSEEQITDRVTADIRACLGGMGGAGSGAAEAKVVSARAVKEKLATFAPTPGVESLRPEVAGPSGLFLAGDYTNTGWPATMEGAVRSGYAAAAAVLGRDRRELVAPSLRVSRLAGVLGLKG